MQKITLDGRRYVIVPQEEYEALVKAARLPPLPHPDADGNYPAVEYARASIVRSFIRDRLELGLSQAELARQAGIRKETLCRIESGRQTPSLHTIEKIEKVLSRKRGKAR